MVRLVLVNGDCRHMQELTPSSVDFAVTSPPYYNAKDYSGEERDIGKQQPYRDYLNDMRDVFREVLRVLKRGHVFALNIANHVYDGRRYPLAHDLLTVAREVGFTFVENIIWEKPEGMSSGGSKRGGVLVQNPYSGYYRPNLTTEFIFVFVKGADITVHDEYHSQAEREKSRVPEDLLAATMSEIWRMAPDSQTPHPAPYPEELPKRAIVLYCPVGGLVLDPFLGSGTTMLAARNLGRDCIGYELNPDYIPLIKEKVGWGMSLMDRFGFVDALHRSSPVAVSIEPEPVGAVLSVPHPSGLSHPHVGPGSTIALPPISDSEPGPAPTFWETPFDDEEDDGDEIGEDDGFWGRPLLRSTEGEPPRPGHSAPAESPVFSTVPASTEQFTRQVYSGHPSMDIPEELTDEEIDEAIKGTEMEQFFKSTLKSAIEKRDGADMDAPSPETIGEEIKVPRIVAGVKSMFEEDGGEF